MRNQRTIVSPVKVSGFGYWSGLDINVEFHPAPINSGIVFVRTDLPSQPRIAVGINQRIDALRRTSLAAGDAAVEMTEHICAALLGLKIDNCEVRVDRAEMPGSDGSCIEFCECLLEAGIREQSAPTRPLIVTQTIRVGDDKHWVEARPLTESELKGGETLRITYDLNYSECAAVGQQTISVAVDEQRFLKQLAPARTFLLDHEAAWLRQQGLGVRVSYQDLLVFNQDGPIDNQLRYADECVRHKAMDVVGDLALVGREIVGHVSAYRSGHQLNAELAQALLEAEASGQREVA